MWDLVLKRIYVHEDIDKKGLNKLILYIDAGTLVGRRFGHSFFYDRAYFQHHIAEKSLPVTIWPNGHLVFTGYQELASHEGVIGILLATFMYCRQHKVYIFWLLGRLVIVIALAGFFIRKDNLFNSEIIGIPSRIPWAFVFGRVDGFPRHQHSSMRQLPI